jgi:hypothetical protein
VLGLGATATGLFALPRASYPRFSAGAYFGPVHDFVRLISDRGRDRLYNGLAQIWWDWGLFLAGGLLVVLVAMAVAIRSRLLGILLTVVALAAGGLHALALAGSADLREAQVVFRDTHSMYENPGVGIWVAFAGFAVLAVAGLLLSMGSRRT